MDESKKVPGTSRQFEVRVLIVEDNSVSGRALVRLLELDGFQARTVADVPSSVRMASEWLPDVLICDLDLGADRDGGDVLRTMKRAHPGLLAVSISGHDPGEANQLSHDYGFAAHLVKPLDPESVLEVVRRLCSGSGL